MLTTSSQSLQQYLSKNSFTFCLYAIVAACSTYAFMYGFRKPVAVGMYDDTTSLGITLKVLYLGAQIVGYALSKFIGIKVISELKSHGRAKAIILLVLLAWLALLGFALTPSPYSAVFMLLNGLPLGMVWGVVFSYLEGRRTTEILAAGLCTSFIVASGLVKSAGSYLMLELSINENWMPFLTASLFLPLLVLSVWMLDQLPAPDKQDIALRKKRIPMNKAHRKDMLGSLGLGLLLLVFGYVLLTILRDLRDSFAANIWFETGFENAPALFTMTELPVALVVLITVALLKLIKGNRNAIFANHFLILFGFIITLLASLAYNAFMIGPVSWMVLNGIGLYLAYVPFTTSLFERIVADSNKPANVGFLTYLADSFGYLGTVAVMFYQSFVIASINWNEFLTNLSIITGVFGILLTLCSLVFFYLKDVSFSKPRQTLHKSAS